MTVVWSYVKRLLNQSSKLNPKIDFCTFYFHKKHENGVTTKNNNIVCTARQSMYPDKKVTKDILNTFGMIFIRTKYKKSVNDDVLKAAKQVSFCCHKEKLSQPPNSCSK